MPRSAEPARRQILDAALKLFAARGIAAVSLREIRLAAKQRNAGALHYHFGSKEGLLKALLERDLPPLVARRRQLLADAASAPGDLRAVAAVFVLPFAEFATGTATEKALIQVLNALHDDVSMSFEKIMGLVGDTAIGDAAALLQKRANNVPAEVLSERLTVAHRIFLHAAATRARGGARERKFTDEAFRQNLVDMFHGALIAPVT